MRNIVFFLICFWPFISFGQFDNKQFYINGGLSYLKAKSEIKFTNSSASNPDPIVSKGQFALSLLPGIFINESSIVGVSLATSYQTSTQNSIELKNRPREFGFYYKKIKMYNDNLGIQIRISMGLPFGFYEYLNSLQEIEKSEYSGLNVGLSSGAVFKLSNSILFEFLIPVINFSRLTESYGEIKSTETIITSTFNSEQYFPFEFSFSFLL